MLAIEPNPQVLERLKFNAALNGFEKTVLCEALGVSDQEGSFSLALDETKHALAEPGAREVIDALWAAVSDNAEITSGRFKEVLDQVKKASRQKGKGLFHPVRIALTGSASGPQLDRLIPLIEAGSRLQLPKAIKCSRNRLIEFREALLAQS